MGSRVVQMRWSRLRACVPLQQRPCSWPAYHLGRPDVDPTPTVPSPSHAGEGYVLTLGSKQRLAAPIRNSSGSDHQALVPQLATPLITRSGFGFISRQSGDDVFVHFSAIQEAAFAAHKNARRSNSTVTKGPKGFQGVPR